MSDKLRTVVNEEYLKQIYQDDDNKKQIEKGLKNKAYGRLKNMSANLINIEYDVSWEQSMGGNMSCTVVAKAEIGDK